MHQENPPITPKKKPLLKWIKRIFIALFSLVAALLIAGFVIIRYYEDDVVGFALEKINANLKTKASVSKVDLTWWDSFPLASLRFNDVYIEETFAEKDTLLFAKKLYLEFNLIDIFKGRYKVREVKTDDAKINLSVNKKGVDNWHFWNSSDSSSSAFSLDLETVQLKNTQLIYEDASSQFFIDLTSEDTEAEGKFSSEEFKLNADVTAQVHSLFSGTTEYALNRNVEAEVEMLANTAHSKYTLNGCSIKVDDLPFELTGEVNAAETDNSLNLALSGDKLDLEDILERLPTDFQNKLKGYKPSGKLTANATIKRINGKNTPVNVIANFDVTDGELEHTDSGIALSGVSCAGKYTKVNEADQLVFDHITAQLETGTFNAQGNLVNLKEPQIDCTVQTNAQLQDLQKFFSWDTLQICEGSISANASLKGAIRFMEIDSTMDWSAVQTTGNASLQNARFQLKGSSREFININGHVALQNSDATVQNLSGNVNGSDFSLTGTLHNVLPFLTNKHERLTIDARFNSQLLDFTNLIETSPANASLSNETYAFKLPDRIDFNLNTNIDKFLFRKFEAREVKGIVHLNNQVFAVDPIAFKTADGTFTAQLGLHPNGGDEYMIECLADLKSIDIQKLFVEFENFGQSFITDANLRGKATAQVHFTTPITTSLQVHDDRLVSQVAVSIDNGELKDLESLQEIAVYMRDNRWIAPFVNEEKFAEKMKDIKFSKLENVIDIRDRKIVIPQMDIKSSAMDISAQGTHTFDNAIDYTIGFKLRDFLIRKDKDIVETDDGLGKLMYIYMKGTVDKPQFGVDKDAAKQNRTQEIQAEKNNVKALLKQELGLFKKDNSVGAYKEQVETQEGTTTVVWDENDPKAPAPKSPGVVLPPKKKATPVSSTKKTDGKKLPKWMQERDETEAPPK